MTAVRPVVVIAPAAGSAARYLHPGRMVGGLWRQRDLIARLTVQDVAQRYRGAYLGVVWSFITPLLLLAVYAFVFSVVFPVRWGPAGGAPPRPGEFALTLFAGLIPFTLFSEVVNRSPSIVLGTPNYVKKVVFPLEALPVVAVGSAVVHSLVSVAILLAASPFVLGSLSAAALLLPLVYLPLVLLTLGLSWFLAALGVYVRDLGHAVVVATQLLFFLSPIFYPVSAVPAPFRVLLDVNPLAPILDGFRRTALWGLPPAWESWLPLTGASGLLALLGYAWFMQTKKGFPDVM